MDEQIAAAVHIAISNAKGAKHDAHNGEKWCRRTAAELVKALDVAGLEIRKKR
jgi:hypothetical protein